jgi:alkaline phosphatase D
MTNSNSNNKNNEATEAISISKAKAKEADISYPEITLTKLAFGSCHKNKAALKVNHENIWPSITNVNPQTFLWLGDAVYSPSKNQSIASIETLRREYDDLVFNSTFGYKDFLQSNEDSSSNSSSSSSNARNQLNSLNLIHGTHDDHDYGANDFGKQMPEKQSRKELFLNFLRSSNDQLFINSSGNDNTKTNSNNDDVTTSNAINDSKYLALKSKIMHRDGLYSSIEYGTYPHKVKIILLDTRSNRDYHCPIPSIGAIKLPLHLGSPLACITRWIAAGLNLLNSNNRFLKDLCKNVKMLSKDQWTWLEEQLGVLDNDIDNDYGNKRNHDDVDDDVALYIIGSSIQVLTTNPAIESWGHYPEERLRLLKLLNNVGMKRRNEKYLTKGPTTGVVILSGDVHHAEILDSSSGMKLNVDNHGQHWKEGDGKIIEVTSSGLTHS